jgi:purine-binding chemotaxis protein CheW
VPVPAHIDVTQYVVVRVGSEEYGLPILAVESIIRYEEPTPVPHARPGITGVLNLRGRVVPVLDLSQVLLGLPFAPSPKARVVVCETVDGPIGLTVDDAREVATVHVDQVRPAPPALATGEPAIAVAGVASLDDRLVLLLEVSRVLSGLGSAGDGVDEESVDDV